MTQNTTQLHKLSHIVKFGLDMKLGFIEHNTWEKCGGIPLIIVYYPINLPARISYKSVETSNLFFKSIFIVQFKVQYQNQMEETVII